MEKYQGKLIRTDIGAGGWQLRTKAGKVYDLEGDIPSNLVNRQVVIVGEQLESFGFMMGGPVIAVESIQVLTN